ncbi:MAG: hypothetical protein M3439_06740 [Chloroflexota bacterium]|nr:hypothetical protein [Chloroflexota bacterium]
MSVRDDLHQLIDELDDSDATVALRYMRKLVNDNSSFESTPRSLENRMGPLVVSGREFSAMIAPISLKELAREQGVKPVNNLADLRADFWPEDESVDEFVATIREWRREGSSGR